MSRKDYVKIADKFYARIMAAELHRDVEAFEGLARDLAVVFADDNPRFDRERFLDHCGVRA